MNTSHPNQRTGAQGSLGSYISGFILSIVLTLAAYFVVVDNQLTVGATVLVVSTLAVIQLYVQMVFFLHIANDANPNWRILAFSFMSIIVGIVVVGSVWIMNNLDYTHLETPERTDQYLEQESQKGF